MAAYPPAYKDLLIDIVYHAVKDWRELDDGRDHVDEDHRAMCNSMGFPDGRSELVSFFESDWFVRICDEFVDIGAEEIVDEIGCGRRN